MDSLASLVQALPPELFRILYDHTFSSSPQEITIDAAYTPPSCLQVSQNTRDAFAKTYYTRSIFYGDNNSIAKWIVALKGNHLDLSAEVRILGPRRFFSRLNPSTIILVMLDAYDEFMEHIEMARPVIYKLKSSRTRAHFLSSTLRFEVEEYEYNEPSRWVAMKDNSLTRSWPTAFGDSILW